MRLKQYLNEMTLPKKKWIVVKLSDLDEETRHKLWDMYVSTYQSIGLHIESINKMVHKYKISWFIDIDKDPEPDAFIIYKETNMGNKLALMGSDGAKESKSLLVKKMVLLLKKRGWFVEASHKVADIIIAKGVPIIQDMEFVKKVIGEKKFVEELEEGEYKRKLGTMGVVKKRMFGNI